MSVKIGPINVIEVRDAVISEVKQYPQYPSEYITNRHEYDFGGALVNGFGGYNLRDREMVWRRNVLRAVYGDSSISILDERVTDPQKYQEALLGREIVVIMGENENEKDYNLRSRGIVGKGLSLEQAFIPDISTLFQTNDMQEALLAGVSSDFYKDLAEKNAAKENPEGQPESGLQ